MSEPIYLAFFLTETGINGDVGYRRGTIAELQLWCHQEGRSWKEEIILVEGQIVKDEGSGVIKGRAGPYKPRKKCDSMWHGENHSFHSVCPSCGSA